jgi:hypothetical protein
MHTHTRNDWLLWSAIAHGLLSVAMICRMAVYGWDWTYLFLTTIYVVIAVMNVRTWDHCPECPR